MLPGSPNQTVLGEDEGPSGGTSWSTLEALELYFEDETLPEGIEPPIIATAQLSA